MIYNVAIHKSLPLFPGIMHDEKYMLYAVVFEDENTELYLESTVLQYSVPSICFLERIDFQTAVSV